MSLERVLRNVLEVFVLSHLALGIPVMLLLLPRGNFSVAQLESLTPGAEWRSPSLHSDTTLGKSRSFTVKVLSLIQVSAFKS